MKVRISATVEDKLNRKLDEFLKNSKYRNKSHIIEIAVEEFMEKEVKNEKKK